MTAGLVHTHGVSYCKIGVRQLSLACCIIRLVSICSRAAPASVTKQCQSKARVAHVFKLWVCLELTFLIWTILQLSSFKTICSVFLALIIFSLFYISVCYGQLEDFVLYWCTFGSRCCQARQCIFCLIVLLLHREIHHLIGWGAGLPFQELPCLVWQFLARCTRSLLVPIIKHAHSNYFLRSQIAQNNWKDILVGCGLIHFLA